MRLLSLRRLRRMPLLWWLVVLLLAGLAGTVVTRSVASAEAAAARYEGLVTVAVASRSLPAGTVVTAGDVHTETWPRAFLPQAAVLLDPVGEVVVVSMIEGEPLVDLKIAPGALGPLAGLLQAGEQAVSVPIGAGTPPLTAGDQVDIVATFDVPDGSPTTPTAVLSSGARVLDVQQDAVTVALDHTDAPRAVHGITKGTVALVLTTGPVRD